MTISSLQRLGACACKQARFTVCSEPLFRFFCHCTICQSLYPQNYADVSVFWAGDVLLPKNADVSFKRYRLPPALQRGTCTSCKAPVLGYLRLAPLLRLAFVPSFNLQDSDSLPDPQAHIFYHRRAEDVHDTLPKINGYWHSEWAVSKMLAKSVY